MKIAIVGSSSITDLEIIESTFSKAKNIEMVISGGAAGIETSAISFCKKRGIPISIYFENKERDGKSARFKKCQKIAEESDGVMVFWDCDSSGALMYVEEAHRAKKPCRVIPVGAPTKDSSSGDISEFSGRYCWLANWWPVTIEARGLKFSSVYSAYKGAHFRSNGRLLKDFSVIPSYVCSELFLKYKDLYPEDFDENFKKVRDEIMYNLVSMKFKQNEYLKQKLLLTKNKDIVNSNSYGDTYWGIFAGKGENKLGKIIMDVRSALK